MGRGPTFTDGDEPKRCRAKAKSTGKRCTKTKVPGKEVCRMHGGLSPGAPITHGRYSKRIPKVLSSAYAAARDEIEGLADLTETLALREALMLKAGERLDDLDTPDFRSRCRKLMAEYRSPPTDKEGNPIRNPEAALDELEELLETGAEEDKAMAVFGREIQEMAVRQEKVWDIRTKGATAVSAKDVAAILARFADIVAQESPREVALAVCGRIDRELLGGGPGGAGAAAGSP